jgi:hypothetical protein
MMISSYILYPLLDVYVALYFHKYYNDWGRHCKIESHFSDQYAAFNK